jgi:hypothetical protein
MKGDMLVVAPGPGDRRYGVKVNPLGQFITAGVFIFIGWCLASCSGATIGYMIIGRAHVFVSLRDALLYAVFALLCLRLGVGAVFRGLDYFGAQASATYGD